MGKRNSPLFSACALPLSKLPGQCRPIAGKMRETAGQRQRRKKARKKAKFTFINHSRAHFKRSEMNDGEKGSEGRGRSEKRKIVLHTFRPQLRRAASVCVCVCVRVSWRRVSVCVLAINVNLTQASHFTSCDFVKCRNVSNWALIYDTISETRDRPLAFVFYAVLCCFRWANGRGAPDFRCQVSSSLLATAIRIIYELMN